MPINATYQELIDGWKEGGSIKEILAFSPRVVWRKLRREVGQGNALITGLLKGCLDAGVTLVNETRAVELVTDKASGRVTGVVADRLGKRRPSRRRVASSSPPAASSGTSRSSRSSSVAR